MFSSTLLYVHSGIAIIFLGKRELVALLSFSSWCLVMVEWLFLSVLWGCLRFVIVVFPDHTHYFCNLPGDPRMYVLHSRNALLQSLKSKNGIDTLNNKRNKFYISDSFRENMPSKANCCSAISFD